MAIRKSAVEGMVKNNFWEGKRVLVTGATGMVGSWLVKELISRRALVVGLILDHDLQSELYRSGDIGRIHSVDGKLEDFSCIDRAINQYEIDTVFHLGAQTIVGSAYRSPLATFESNIRGSYHVLEACRLGHRLIKRVVVASSDKAYGEQKKLPYLEHMPLEGRFPYEVSKSCTDLLAQSYARSYDLPVAIMRCGNIYGGGDLNWSRIVPGAIRAFLKDETFVIRSDGKYIRDYVFVRNVCDVYLRLAQAMDSKQVRGEAFNYSAEERLTVMQVVKAIEGVMGKKKRPVKILNNAPGEIPSQYLSSDKIRRVLNYKEHTSLADGLKQTVEWYREFFAQQP